MPAHNSWTLVVATMRQAAETFQTDMSDAINDHSMSRGSGVINLARMASMQRVMIAVGGFSMLEGILEQTRGGLKPFQELEKQLEEIGEISLCGQFKAFRLATNVLKHGSGESYRRLLSMADLPFRIKQPGQMFFEEGDLHEIPALIDVDMDFVRMCADVIESAFVALRIPHLDV